MDPSEFTLLVVDDIEENRDVLSRRLARRGFNVQTAEDGQRALDLIAAEKIDLVLLDIMMPGLTGLDVLERLRSQPETEDLPVIIQSAKSESDDIVEALELGASDYVTKPLDFPIVMARVQAQLRARRPAKTAEPASSGGMALGDLEPGITLADRYRIEAKLGEGNFGSVFRATHLDLGRSVAIKVLQARVHAGAGDAVARFRREGVAACRVKHPNAVAILDFGVTTRGLAYLVMELLDGHSLEEELLEEGVVSPARCAQILVPVCDALGAAHAAGIVHRDIKPGNIYLHRTDLGEVPKVLDFGIAKIAGEAALQDKLTVEGYVLGTPVYMAPERFRNQGYDGSSDVYSLGVMLYQMIVGRLPFVPPPDDPMAVVAMHMTRPPEPLRQHDPDVPPEVEAIILECLAKQPKERPGVFALAKRFADAASGATGVASLGPIGACIPARTEPAVIDAGTVPDIPLPDADTVTPRDREDD